jgi:hypothetical protein
MVFYIIGFLISLSHPPSSPCFLTYAFELLPRMVVSWHSPFVFKWKLKIVCFIEFINNSIERSMNKLSLVSWLLTHLCVTFLFSCHMWCQLGFLLSTTIQLYSEVIFTCMERLMLALNMNDSIDVLWWDHSLVNVAFIWHRWIPTCLPLMIFNNSPN